MEVCRGVAVARHGVFTNVFSVHQMHTSGGATRRSVPYRGWIVDIVKEFMAQGGVIPSQVQNAVRDIFQRLHPDTREVLETFEGMREVEMRFMIKKKALMQAIQGDLVIRGARWTHSTIK